MPMVDGGEADLRKGKRVPATMVSCVAMRPSAVRSATGRSTSLESLCEGRDVDYVC